MQCGKSKVSTRSWRSQHHYRTRAIHKRAAPLPPPPSAGEKESDKKGCACPENTQHFILHWAESRQSGEGRVVVFLYQLDIQRRDFIWNFSLIRPKRCSHIAVVLRTNLSCLWRRTERSAPTPLALATRFLYTHSCCLKPQTKIKFIGVNLQAY